MDEQWTSIRQFTNWWWRSGQPFAVPNDAVKRCEGSHEFVMYRCGRFQVEQVTLFPGYAVPPHSHPNVETYECHLVGGGHAVVGGVRLPEYPSEDHHPKHRRIYIPAGIVHSGWAYVTNVALSFQRWHNDVPPTFITDDWEGPAWL